MILLMAMALAIALVACQGAAGVAGEAGKPGEAAKQPPYVAFSIADVTVVEGESKKTETSLTKAFRDPEGKALKFTAESDDEDTATAAVSDGMLTVTGVKAGNTSIVVTATDPDDLSVGQSVKVTVTAAPPVPEPPVTIADVIKKYPKLTLTPTTAADVSMEIELPADHSLRSANDAIVTVAAKKTADKSTPESSIQWASETADDATTTAKNVWVVTAVSEGIANVYVLDKSKGIAHTIAVSVTTNPPATKPDGPVAVGTIPAVSLDVDGTKDITLDGLFTDSTVPAQTLTYTVTSSVMTIATAKLDSTTAPTKVTITAVAAGSATVTLTATDPDSNTAKHEIAVTVKVAATPGALPATVTLEGAGAAKKKTFTLTAGHSLVSNNTSVVTEKKVATAITNDWELQGVKRGSATVTEWDASTPKKVVQTVTVTVKNTAPAVKTALVPTPNDRFRLFSTGITRPVPSNSALSFPSGITTRRYHQVKHAPATTLSAATPVLDVTAFFMDADSDPLTYEVTPSYNGIETKEVSASGLLLDVLWAPPSGALFTLKIRAVDNQQAMSEWVTVQIVAADANPIAERYEVEQDVSGNFFDVTVSRRRVKNQLVFPDPINSVTGTEYGFAFVDKYTRGSAGKEFRPYAAIENTSDRTLTGAGQEFLSALPYVAWTGTAATSKAHAPFDSSPPTTIPVIAETRNEATFKPNQGFVITSTGSITVSHPKVPFIGTVPLLTATGVPADPPISGNNAAASGNNPWLFLTVSGTTSGTVTIDYWAWVDPDGAGPETGQDQDAAWKKATTGTFKVTIE